MSNEQLMYVTNRKKHGSMLFSEYVKFPAKSNSGLKNNGKVFVATSGMEFGTLVDALITQRDRVDYKSPQYADAKRVADHLMAKYSFIEHAQKQVAFTGMLTDGTRELYMKGLLDFYLEHGDSRTVIDMKITGASLSSYESTIKHFGYDDQLWIYGNLAGAEKRILLVYSTKNKRSELMERKMDSGYNEFYYRALHEHGKPTQALIENCRWRSAVR